MCKCFDPYYEGSAASTKINQLSVSPPNLRARQRVIAYRRRPQISKAKRNIKTLIQNKRRKDFLHVKCALFEIGSYKGKNLPTSVHKKHAGKYIRTHGLGQAFVEDFDDVVKWKCIHHVVEHPDSSPLNLSAQLLPPSALPYNITAA